MGKQASLWAGRARLAACRAASARSRSTPMPPMGTAHGRITVRSSGTRWRCSSRAATSAASGTSTPRPRRTCLAATVSCAAGAPACPRPAPSSSPFCAAGDARVHSSMYEGLRTNLPREVTARARRCRCWSCGGPEAEALRLGCSATLLPSPSLAGSAQSAASAQRTSPKALGDVFFGFR